MNDDTAQQCAAHVMDTFHAIMRSIRPETRKGNSTDLSMQQFRALMTIDRHPGASLSIVSEQMGATLSSASKRIENLVELGYVWRENSSDDRRRLILGVTDRGAKALDSLNLEVVDCLAERLSSLTSGERTMVNLAMELLRTALISTRPALSSGQQK